MYIVQELHVYKNPSLICIIFFQIFVFNFYHSNYERNNKFDVIINYFEILVY